LLQDGEIKSIISTPYTHLEAIIFPMAVDIGAKVSTTDNIIVVKLPNNLSMVKIINTSFTKSIINSSFIALSSYDTVWLNVINQLFDQIYVRPFSFCQDKSTRLTFLTFDWLISSK